MDAFECKEGTALCVDEASDSEVFKAAGAVSKAKGVEVACELLRQARLFDFLLPLEVDVLQAISPCGGTFVLAPAEEQIMVRIVREEAAASLCYFNCARDSIPTPGRRLHWPW